MASPLLEAVRAGATFDEACRARGVNVSTARAWAYRGRKAPEGRYGAFARELDAIRDTTRQPAPADRSALTREEWEGYVAQAVRAGNVAAMRMWAEAHGADTAAPDSFSEFDP